MTTSRPEKIHRLPRKPKRGWRDVLWLFAALVAGAGAALGWQWFSRLPQVTTQENFSNSLAGYYLSARFAERQRDFNHAAVLLSEIVEQHPEQKTLRERSFLLQVLAGRMKQAIALAAEESKTGKATVAAQLLLAVDAMQRGDYQTADSNLKILLKDNDPSALKLHKLLVPVLRSWVWMGLGRYPEARQLLAEVEAGPEMESALLFQRALVEDIGGNAKEATRLYDELLRITPKPSLRMSLAAASFFKRNGQEERAEEVMEPARRQVQGITLTIPTAAPIATANEGLADFLLDLANMLYVRRMDEAALIYLRLSLHLRDNLSQAKFLLAMIKQLGGANAEAIDALSAIPSNDPFYPEAQRNIARNYLQEGKTEEAQRFLEARLRIAPEDLEARTLLAEMLLQQKEYAAANRHYSALLEQAAPNDPERLGWLYARGIGWERLKQWPKAEADFKAALALDPDNPDVLNYLAYSWVVQNMHLEEARLMLSRAVEARPNDAHIIDSYGWALFALGKYEEALIYMERANELMPADPTVNDHLGDVYWKLGRQREARFQWERALIFKPEPEDEAAIRQKLQHGLRTGKD